VPTISQPRGTVLYDAVYLAANEKLRAEVGRKVIVLITDGIDEGSKLKIEEAIEAAQKSDVVIYSMDYADPSAYGRFSFGVSDFALQRMSGETGGRVFQSGPQAYPGRRLQATAGRNAQPVFHRLHLNQSRSRTARSANWW
jgi:VWFA-related protein